LVNPYLVDPLDNASYCAFGGVHIEVKNKKNKQKKRDGEQKQTKNKKERPFGSGCCASNQCSFGERILAVPNKSQRDYHTCLVQ